LFRWNYGKQIFDFIIFFAKFITAFAFCRVLDGGRTIYPHKKLHDFYPGPCAALPVKDIENIQADIPFLHQPAEEIFLGSIPFNQHTDLQVAGHVAGKVYPGMRRQYRSPRQRQYAKGGIYYERV